MGYRETKDLAVRLAGLRRSLGKADLVAVTKYYGVREVLQLYAEGQRVFGESRVADARDKIAAVDATWHLIGHLQSNKAREAVELFDWIDTIDSVRIAEKVSGYALAQAKRIDALIQVNVGKEPQKSGIDPNALADLITHIKECRGIRVRGLMCITPDVSLEERRPYFRRMRELFSMYPQFDTLSMGMSDDYPVAVSEGATMVRIGRRLFDGTDIQ